MWHGTGTWSHSALGVYNGEWSEGRFHGSGALRYAREEKIFNGTFRAGCPVAGTVIRPHGGGTVVEEVTFPTRCGAFEKSLEHVTVRRKQLPSQNFLQAQRTLSVFESRFGPSPFSPLPSPSSRSSRSSK